MRHATLPCPGRRQLNATRMQGLMLWTQAWHGHRHTALAEQLSSSACVQACLLASCAPQKKMNWGPGYVNGNALYDWFCESSTQRATGPTCPRRSSRLLVFLKSADVSTCRRNHKPLTPHRRQHHVRKSLLSRMIISLHFLPCWEREAFLVPTPSTESAAAALPAVLHARRHSHGPHRVPCCPL